LGPVFRDGDAGDGGRDGPGRPLRLRAWLGIEGFKLAGPPRHPQNDARLPCLPKFVGMGAQIIKPVQGGKPGHAGPGPAQEPAPAHRAVPTHADLDPRLSLAVHGVIPVKIHRMGSHSPTSFRRSSETSGETEPGNSYRLVKNSVEFTRL